LRARAKGPRQGTSRNLYITSQPRPVPQPLWLAAQDSIALRVRNDWTHALKLQIVQGVVHGRRDRDFVELNKQIVMLVYAKSRRVLAQGLDIFRVEMEVASGGQFQPLPNFTLQVFAETLYAGIIEGIFAAAVGRGHYVRDAVLDR